jgi:hypothetical protein
MRRSGKEKETMIKVPFPHMCLHSHDVPGEKYKMWNTDTVPANKTVPEMVDQIVGIARTAPGGYLETLIFNSHGWPGRILIGTIIDRTDCDAGKFKPILDGRLVRNIWIVACEVAYIEKAGTVSDGNYFCYRFAQSTGAYVTAGTAVQWSQKIYSFGIGKLPYGYIDDWEGEVFRWNPEGKLC